MTRSVPQIMRASLRRERLTIRMSPIAISAAAANGITGASRKTTGSSVQYAGPSPERIP